MSLSPLFADYQYTRPLGNVPMKSEMHWVVDADRAKTLQMSPEKIDFVIPLLRLRAILFFENYLACIDRLGAPSIGIRCGTRFHTVPAPPKIWVTGDQHETASVAGPRPDSPCRSGGKNRWRHLHSRHRAGEADGRRGDLRRPGDARRHWQAAQSGRASCRERV